mgnify:CR=1 FL=1|nr:hypothetical protein DGKKSRWO_DGKKSRWO_CDS_0039 [uncultured phage]CAI9752177.1 hypothetical protein CVNMHQAP_CVNMHQAP_CDS_0039 [uncultured phage]
MIPVVTMDAAGNKSYQLFNDNLTTVEQINRVMLDSIVYAQMKLVNDDTSVAQKIGQGAYSEAQLATIKTAAEALNTAVKAAVAAFETAVAGV